MTASNQIDLQIKSFPDWRGKMMARLRHIISETDPEICEEWKWDTGVWTHCGMVCAVSAFKDHVKINFFQGASLQDPLKLFNSGLDSKKHRSVNFSEKDKINEAALKDLIVQAVAINTSR